MTAETIELTAQEEELVARIDFNPESSEGHGAAYWNAVGEAAFQLMQSLLRRDAIPKVRRMYFTEPAFNIGGRGRSREQIFVRNGTRGDAIFRHPHFLKYLHYFLRGPDLPHEVIKAFRQRIAEIGLVTSSDIVPLGAFARQLTRTSKPHDVDPAEEFYKLALDCGLELHEAASIRNSVKAAR